MVSSMKEFFASRTASHSALRQELHRIPELGFDLFQTVQAVQAQLDRLGIEYETGIGRTGLVGTIRGRTNGSGKAVGLRADMDALPMPEQTGLPYASQNEGRMHGCGHDGHTAMLLAAAEYLNETRAFDGTVHLIFQPGEEGWGGAKEMIADGLFTRFPVDQVYGLHNWPMLPLGQVSIPVGPIMAAASMLKIVVHGAGGHGGVAPHRTVDPVLVASHIVLAAQSIVARNLDPLEAGVVSLCSIVGGNAEAFNVIPNEVTLTGTTRALRPEVLQYIEERLRQLCADTARAYGGSVTVEMVSSPATINTEAETLLARRAAQDIVGEAGMTPNPLPSLGGEDFAYMLMERPGAFIHIGTGDENHVHDIHTTQFDFNDKAIPIGAGVLSRIAELALPLN